MSYSLEIEGLVAHKHKIEDENANLRARVAELQTALTKCADRLERCAINSGTAPEYAAIAVEEYRKLVERRAA